MTRPIRWPRCRFRFVASLEDARAGRWRTCALPWGHWLAPGFRHRGPLIEAPAPLDTPQEELTIALRSHLYSELASAPKGKLTWVMSADWLKECLLLDNRWAYRTLEANMAHATLLLGIPFEIRDDAGVPQLVPRGEPE